MKRKEPSPSVPLSLPTVPVQVGKKRSNRKDRRPNPSGGGGGVHPPSHGREALQKPPVLRGPSVAGPAAQVEPPAGTMKNQTVYDPPTKKFTWTIQNFTRLTMNKHYSDVLIVDDSKWRVFIFSNGDYLSMYLEVWDASLLPSGWCRYAQFRLCVVSQINNKFSVRKDTQHQFNAREIDWGFTSFMSLRDLNDSTRGYLVNDKLVIEAKIFVTKGTGFYLRTAAQVAPASKVENQPVYDPPAMKFTSTIQNFTRTRLIIPNFTQLTTKKRYSDAFIVDDCKWRVYLSLGGHNVDYLSMSLHVAAASSLPFGWSRYARFSFRVVNQINNYFSVTADTQHLCQFNARAKTSGFMTLLPLRDLYDPNRGYLVNDTIVIEAAIVVTKKNTSHGLGKESSDLPEEVDDDEVNAYVSGGISSPRRGVPSSGSSPQARNEALVVSPPTEQSPPRASPLPVSQDVDDEVAVVETTPVIESDPLPTPICPPSAPFVAASPLATSSLPGTGAPPASISLPDDDDSDLALFESIGITFPVSKKSRTDALTSSATTAQTPTSKRTEILKALSTVVCYLHDVRDLKNVDSNAKPSFAVSKALETLKTQGSGLLPKEKITMISKLSTDIMHTVSRYKICHDLLQGIATDEKDIAACTKAFEVADATIKNMSTDYWEARQQRDAKRKEFALAEDEISRLQVELARAQEHASELKSQLTEAEQRRLNNFKACTEYKDTVYESARIERERVAQSQEHKKALYAKEKDDLFFFLNPILILFYYKGEG